jgi:hypothetical protein
MCFFKLVFLLFSLSEKIRFQAKINKVINSIIPQNVTQICKCFCSLLKKCLLREWVWNLQKRTMLIMTMTKFKPLA